MSKNQKTTDLLREIAPQATDKHNKDYSQEMEQWKKQAITALSNYLYARNGKTTQKGVFVNQVQQAWAIIEKTITHTVKVEYKHKKTPSQK